MDRPWKQGDPASRAPEKGPTRRCLLCASTRRSALFPESDLPWVVRCDACQLVFAEPQPTDEELASIYDEQYYEQFGFVEGDAGAHADHAGLAETKRATFARMLALAAPHVRSRPRGGTPRLMDVGCGLGYSLLAAKDCGYDATGLDPLGKSQPDRHIVRGDLDNFSDAERFDVVSLIDVIEHVRDPIETLKLAERHLAPGGVLLLATNDSSSAGARLLGPRWTHFHRAHLWFFNPETLGAVAERAGYEVVAVERAPRVYNLDYIASILAWGSNFQLAANVSRVILRVVPERLRALPWPAVPEGFLLVARRRGGTTA